MGQRDADAAGAAAEIQNTGVHFSPVQRFNGRIDQYLGIHPGDKHVGIDKEGQPVEFPGARHIGHRLAGQPPPDHLRGALLDLGGRIDRQIAQKLRIGLAGGHAGDDPGLQIVTLHTVPAQGVSHVYIDVVVRLSHNLPLFSDYHASAPFSSGMTSFMARMAHSIMPSSGSLVVSLCSHLPGADSPVESQLSCRPHQRLIS